ncbi:MAG: GNAT family N-acetyltransferase [Prevotella sp.]|nr:GNAT family N-acetyltransferase [Bacteroides sp.]MCM1366834.1 GNAT family N-acetyltransferase [Prevotella sp.]MCM1437184.1 GNAT family N-acetyltransferase [Prevotella sp.]
MKDGKIRVVPANKEDSRLIAEAVVAAIGPELEHNLANGRDVSVVTDVFTELASREDSQYSYLNSLKGIDEDGNVVGIVVGYDGMRLHELRKAFFEVACRKLGFMVTEKELREVPDETGPEEYYLDSLAVFPENRGRGIAKMLIKAMAKRGVESHKPLGLLCDKSNRNARRLYDSMGFRKVGERYFAGELMDHMVLEVQDIIY